MKSPAKFQSYLTGIEMLGLGLLGLRLCRFQSYLTGIEIRPCAFVLLPLLRSNRTLLELKYFTEWVKLSAESVPIVPYWN